MTTDTALLVRVLENAGRAARTLGATFGPAGVGIGLALSELLQAAAVAMRDEGKSLEQVLRDIRAPRKIDLSFRDELDAQVNALPDVPPRKPGG